MATMKADMIALDVCNAMADQVARVSKVNLQTIAGPANLQKELGTKGYILHALFGAQCTLIQVFSVEVVDHIHHHFDTFERQMGTTQRCTAFAYDVS